MVSKLSRDSRGQVLVVTALMLPVVIGFVALALDAGFMFDYRRRSQTAADAGVLGAAMYLAANASASNTDLETVARQDSAFNGFTHGTTNITVTLNRPPVLSTDYAGNSNYIEVVVSRPTPTFLMGVLGWTSMTVGASAVAGLSSASGCIYALKQDTGVKSLDVSNTKTINAANCDAVGNGKLFVDGTVNLNSVTAAGAREGSGTINAPAGITVNTGTYAADPLAYLANPTECTSWGPDLLLNNTSYTIPGGAEFICVNKLETTGTVTLGPGRYHAQNGVFLKAPGSVTGSGVTFFTYNDKMEIIANATLSAPTSGSYAGILIFVNRTVAKEVIIGNDAIINLNGTIYSKTGKILFGGTTTGTITYSILVAGEILFSDDGSVTFNNNFGGLSTAPVKTVKIVD